MADDAERAETDRKAVDEEEKRLNADDAINEAIQQFLRENRVFFYQLGEVV